MLWSYLHSHCRRALTTKQRPSGQPPLSHLHRALSTSPTSPAHLPTNHRLPILRPRPAYSGGLDLQLQEVSTCSWCHQLQSALVFWFLKNELEGSFKYVMDEFVWGFEQRWTACWRAVYRFILFFCYGPGGAHYSSEWMVSNFKGQCHFDGAFGLSNEKVQVFFIWKMQALPPFLWCLWPVHSLSRQTRSKEHLSLKYILSNAVCHTNTMQYLNFGQLPIRHTNAMHVPLLSSSISC